MLQSRLKLVLKVLLFVLCQLCASSELNVSQTPKFKTPASSEVLSENWPFSSSQCGKSMPIPTTRFYLYTNKSDPNESKAIKFGDMNSLHQSEYQRNASWKVLIHGFLQHKDAFFPRSVKDAYLKRMQTHVNRRYNVLVVDWGNKNCSSISARVKELLSYNSYADCTTAVALQVAQMLVFLQKHGAIDQFETVHIVGFSLGAHVAGQTGRNVTDLTGHKIGRITGLDPGGPSSPWWEIFTKHHLDLGPLDADFVDVIHTSSVLGTGRRMGHVDFWVNAGSDQPGCIPDPVDFVINDFLQICSHNFAVDLFSKSILDNSRKGCACGSISYWNYLKYLVGWCTCHDQAVLGEYINPRFSAGEYFVSTPYEEVNWRKYMKTLNESELQRSDSRVLALLEVLCLV